MKKAVLGLILGFLWNAFAWAEVPKYISFQGELTDTAGTRITTSKSVTFAIYGASSGGSALFSEAQTLTPSSGIVSATIGSQTAGGVPLAFDTQYYLGVTVSPDAEMTPRVRLSTSPYAFTAKFLDTDAMAHGSLAVAGTVTASAFVGNGSGLTGISAGSSQWTTGANGIYVDTFVGIGTASPSALLQVNKAFGGVDAHVGSFENTTVAGGSFVEIVNTNGSSSRKAVQFRSNDLGDGAGGFSVAPGATPGTFGTPALVIKAGGNVGIGTTTPASKLDVTGTVTATAFVGSGAGLTGISGGGSSQWTTSGDSIYIDSAVGIGTTAPRTKLQVGLKVIDDNNFVYDTNGLLVVHQAQTGTSMLNDPKTVLMLARQGKSSEAFGPAATFNMSRYENNGTSSRTRLDISLAHGAFDPTSNTIMTLLSSGNVGIGTASPAANLSVSGVTSNLNLALHPSADLMDIDFNGLRNDAKNVVGNPGRLIRLDNRGGNPAISFWTRAASAAYPSGSEHMRMVIEENGNVGVGVAASSNPFQVGADSFVVKQSTGYVGIGTTSPASKLDVNGTVTATAFSGSGAGLTGISVSSVSPSSLSAPISSDSIASGAVTSAKLTGSVNVTDSLVVGDTRLVVLKSGDIGMGTATPLAKLDVTGTDDAGPQEMLRLSKINYGSSFFTQSYTDAANWGITLHGSSGPPNAFKFNMASGRLGIGTTSPSDSLHVVGPARFSDSMTVGDTVFVVNSKSGNVGIGTTSPGAKLDVVGSVLASDSLVVGDTRLVALKTGRVGIGTNAPNYALDVQTSGANQYVAQFQNTDASGSSYGLSIDITGGSAASVRPALSITTGGPGNVFEVKASGKTGLGTTSPLSRLHVAGDVKVQDTFTVQDTALVVKENGNVGVGNSNPGSELAFATSGAVTITGPTAGGGDLRIKGNTVTMMNSTGGIVARFNNVTDQLSIQNGSATAPGLGFVNGTATGIHAPGSNALAVATGGVDRMRFDTTGNIGIGTTTPTDSLVVKGGVVSDSLAVGDTRFVVLKNGSVGIGTANPASKLQVIAGDMTLDENKWISTNTTWGIRNSVGSFSNGTNTAYTIIKSIDNNTNFSGIDFQNYAGNSVMFIKEPGKVGIGTTTPTDSLVVKGGIVSDSLAVGGTFLVAKPNGNVGVGTSSPGAKLHVVGNVVVSDTMTVGDTFLVVQASGRVGIGTSSPDTDFSVNGGASKVGGGSWATFSDSRLKNVEGVFEPGIEQVMKLQPVRYRYKKENAMGIKDGSQHVGFVAQDVQAAIPDAVYTNDKGYLMLNQDPILWAMLNAIQEQQDKIERQSAEIESLRNSVEELKNRTTH